MVLLNSHQLRAARALLRWDAEELAKRAGVSVRTLRRLEALQGDLDARPSTIRVIEQELEKAGIELINGNAPGARLHLDVAV